MGSSLSYQIVASVCLASSLCLAANLQFNIQEHRPIITSNNKIENNISISNNRSLIPAPFASGENNDKNSSQVANLGNNFSPFGNIVLDSGIFDGLGGLLTLDEDQQATFGQINYDEQQQQHPSSRESRRFGPVRSNLGSLWSKPKVSPLYLINGTVCRFVNSNPICTTLSTQGLLRKYNLIVG